MKLKRFNGQAEAEEFLERNKSMKALYQTMTARELAGLYHIDFSDYRTERAFVKALNKTWPKKLGWGGKRTGSGNKPGWNKEDE